ncbi:MAG: class I SAM-dependent methyltransferase [Cyclobacteriaceae bacterium]|nr:class I SAM-dependent methyltransferase [Cyclobacteriaceae bacterium]
MKQSEKYDRRFSSGYLESWPAWKKARVRKILSSLGLKSGEQRGLDFGCGRGEFTRIIKDELPDWRIDGADVSGVAVSIAHNNVPDCRFFVLNVESSDKGQYDFIFSHHVLEHVEDIDSTISQIAEMCKPGALMLHILPSGGKGSLENLICEWRSDGFDVNRGCRMFFEHAEHHRRLTAEQLVSKFELVGCRAVSLRYANKVFGSIEWITTSSVELISKFTGIRALRSRNYVLPVLLLRSILILLFAARFPVTRYSHYRSRYKKRLLYRVSFLLCVLMLPFAMVPDFVVKLLSSIEFRMLKGRVGSEMYLVLRKIKQ